MPDSSKQSADVFNFSDKRQTTIGVRPQTSPVIGWLVLIQSRDDLFRDIYQSPASIRRGFAIKANVFGGCSGQQTPVRTRHQIAATAVNHMLHTYSTRFVTDHLTAYRFNFHRQSRIANFDER